MMRDLDVSGWGEFVIGEICQVKERGSKRSVPTGSLISKQELQFGAIPRVSVSGQNNGVVGVFQGNHPKMALYENFVSVSFLGSVFYQPNEVSLEMKVHCVKPVDHELTEAEGLFLASVVRQSLVMRGALSYGDQVSSSALAEIKVKLPQTPAGEPDWEAMGQLMSGVLETARARVVALESQGVSLTPIDTEDWGEFRVGDLFTIKGGRGCSRREMQDDGELSVVQSSAVDQGVVGRMSAERAVEKGYLVSTGLSLTLAGTGSTGFVGMHTEPIVVGNNAKLLVIDRELSEIEGLFLSGLLNSYRSRFSYGEIASASRYSELVIKLPQTSAGEPDWDVMSQMMESVMTKAQRRLVTLQEGDV